MMRVSLLTSLMAGALGLSLAAPAFAEATVAWKLDGFTGPESVALDPATGVIYVSSYGVDPMKKDGDGFISTITADGKIANLKWVSGLDSPKGLDVVGGKLYAADVDQLVEIDIASGQVTNRFLAEGAKFLNDVVAAPDGKVYVSDTFGASVYVLDQGKLSLFVQDKMLMGANGLIIDGGSLLVADLGDISKGFTADMTPGAVVKVDLATKAMSAYGAEGPVGILDGIELDGKGGVYLTDNPAGKVLDLMPGGTATEVATVGAGAADLEVDTKDGLILVPVSAQNAVIALKLN
jgi:DNA-binding beta-propeller fold protein YncE